MALLILMVFSIFGAVVFFMLTILGNWIEKINIGKNFILGCVFLVGFLILFSLENCIIYDFIKQGLK